MPTHKPGSIENGQDGLALAGALRDCLGCGFALVNLEAGSVVFNPEAEEMLGLAPSGGNAMALETLPAGLGEAVRSILGESPTAKAENTKPIGPMGRIGPMGHVRQLSLPNRGTVTLSFGLLELPGPSARSNPVLLLRDLTPLRKIEQKIWRLDRLAGLGTLSASMAHEIKNALVAGKTFIDLLLEKHQDAELVDIVRREMARIDSIVSRMLNFVGQARPAFAPVNLHDSLDHSLLLAQPQLDTKGIVLTRSFLAAPEIIDGDDHELQQAFVNLFLNALEAMPANGTLTVATETIPSGAASNGELDSSPPHLRVTIKDSGAGIAPQDMVRLFEPFFTTKPAGTGLGLPITQRIIHEHRGAIEVESQPGQGTIFRITLPALV